ncbi:MAG: MFS transporter [archaeon]
MIKINRVIWLLILSDILIVSSFGLISPIFAIFMKDGIPGGSVVAAGTAATVYWLVKSVLQLPFSLYLDKKRHKLSFLYVGTFLIIMVPIIYAIAKDVYWIYAAQIFYALGAAMAVPTWLCLFTMHIDSKHRGFEWALWSTSIGLGTALAAFLGAELVGIIGFKVLFFIVSGISFLGFLILIGLSRKHLIPEKKVKRTSHIHKASAAVKK